MLEYLKAHPVIAGIAIGVIVVLAYMILMPKKQSPTPVAVVVSTPSGPVAVPITTTPPVNSPVTTPVAAPVAAPVVTPVVSALPTAPVPTTGVAWTAPTTPQPNIDYCVGGYYCDGTPIPIAQSVPGIVTCGRGPGTGIQYQCVRNPDGSGVHWVAGAACPTTMANACKVAV